MTAPLNIVPHPPLATERAPIPALPPLHGERTGRGAAIIAGGDGGGYLHR